MDESDRSGRSGVKGKLTPLQYEVTQREATEPPFDNDYWDEKRPGIYVDVVTGEPLFSSTDKFDSSTGWPSFTKPIDPANLATRVDRSLFAPRTEVRSKGGDSHLGHVFDDGPGPEGKRYCINSAALRFIPAERLEAEGYGRYSSLFAANAGRTEKVVLAGGCFWGMEEILGKIPGVIETSVGYTGGATKDPTYPDVKKGDTGHAEAVRITFDPSRLRFEDLLAYFFRMHDPTTVNRQGNDMGTQYRSAIFFETQAQRATAERVKQRVDASGRWKKPVVTQIVRASAFYPAEDDHQDYLAKNPGGYTCHFLRE